MSRQVCREAARQNHSNTPWNLNKDKGLGVFFITDFLKNEAGQNISKCKQWTGLCREAARQDLFFIRDATEQIVAITIAMKWQDGLNTQRKMTRPLCYDRVMPRSGETRLLHSCFFSTWLRHETLTERCHRIVITGQDHDSFHSVTRHLGYVMRRLWIHRVTWWDGFEFIGLRDETAS